VRYVVALLLLTTPQGGRARGEVIKGIGRTHGVAFNAKVAFAAFKDDKTLAGLATQFGVHLAKITNPKVLLLDCLSFRGAFDSNPPLFIYQAPENYASTLVRTINA
jgi:hypothetical protein